MKKLILVRHGEYEENEEMNLSQEGRKQIESLAEKLSAVTNGNPPLILVSPTTRTIESAEIISKKLDAIVEKYKALYIGNRTGFSKFLEILHERLDNEIIIAVTHLEFCEGFPKYFGREYLEGIEFESERVEVGEACVVDIETKTIKIIRRD